MIDKIFVCHHKPLTERKEKLQKFFIENGIDVEWVENYLPDEIEQIDTILKSIDDVEYNKLLENGRKVYEEYFTLEGMFKNIIKRIL